MTEQLSQLSDASLASLDIKVVFFDVDGTLLRADGTYSAATAAQISRIQKLGIKTAAATGRPHYAAEFLAQELGIDAMGSYCTGAYVFEPASQTCLSSACISPQVAKDFLSDVRRRSVYYEIYTERQYGLDHHIFDTLTETHSHHLRCKPERAAVDNWLETRPTLKFLLGEDMSQGQQLLSQLEQDYPSLIFAYAAFPAFPNWRFASVVSAQACKRTAFQKLLDYYQVSAENVASFGDSQSDMAFIQAAGVGVAMGNAGQPVKQVARFVTHDVEQDGVAYALSRLV